MYQLSTLISFVLFSVVFQLSDTSFSKVEEKRRKEKRREEKRRDSDLQDAGQGIWEGNRPTIATIKEDQD